MSAAVATLLRDALDLTEDQRLELASELIASVDGPADEDWDSVWLEELDRRVARAEARAQDDPERGDDWAVVKQRVLGRLGR